jgi:exonuclease SbcD
VRLFHTSDWHVGVTTRGASRSQDIADALDELTELAADFKPDLIVHSGDLFHQPRPLVDELELAWSGLRRLAEKAPVVVIAGNHDSPQLFEFFAAMLQDSPRIHFIGQPKKPSQGGILKFPGARGETIKLACMPFVHANRMVPGWDLNLGGRLIAYADRVMRLQKAYAEALHKGYSAQRDILLYTAHLFVDGASLSTSERSLHVSDTYATRVSAIPPVSYAAFGHIHKPQSLPGGAPGRYAGSLIPMDFGEENDVKETVLIEAAPGQSAQVRRVPLSRSRRLVTLVGSKPELEAQSPALGACILRLKVNHSLSDPGLSEWARRVFPLAEIVEISETRPAPTPSPRSSQPRIESRSLHEAFAAYAEECGLAPDLAPLIEQLEASDEDLPSLPEVEELARWVART